ncbi:hypothetical protein ACJ73_08918 [Blastomyces percursus]|uniref:Uncharacterized protein n=1 Tax=Blastomyces percursus TaxID=1658174 RepID=A0A1J9Q719_9EURO|nr:hypothetical protein ACJ73_08918 [Blastomyces percursus]
MLVKVRMLLDLKNLHMRSTSSTGAAMADAYQLRSSIITNNTEILNRGGHIYRGDCIVRRAGQGTLQGDPQLQHALLGSSARAGRTFAFDAWWVFAWHTIRSAGHAAVYLSRVGYDSGSIRTGR